MSPASLPSSTSPGQPLQPLLNEATIVFRAPTQAWSASNGELGAAAIDGVYHGDVRHIRAISLVCADSVIEWISAAPDGADRVVFGGLLRGLDDPTPDPKVRLTRDRRVAAGRLTETLTIVSRLMTPITTTLSLRLRPEFAPLHDLKAGLPGARPVDIRIEQDPDAGATFAAGPQRFVLRAAGARLETDGDDVVATWPVQVAPGGRTEVAWSVELRDDALVVREATSPTPWNAAALAEEVRSDQPRLARWLETALSDLDALRLALPDDPEDEFFAAGTPWFFTLFGRDALWAARLTLPVDVGIAASTLRVLARLQGTERDPDTAQEPGKILHELRATTLEMPGEGIVLPPLYYGSVDSTPLWVCVLADAWRAGMPEAEVRDLLPALLRALRWIVEHGDSDGDGFLDYVDRTGRGLANQGWKDSGDSIQWRDGTLAHGPIALCEVQAYAYEAAMSGADLLEALGEDLDPNLAAPAPEDLRTWAARLRARFAEAYWVRTPEGRYPAIALDRDKRPVDTLTSNIGHLLGTGLLDPDDEAHVASLLVGPTMSSGYGIRTMSTAAAGYWPLSYHGGSVWTHDSAICAHGMARAGLWGSARQVVDGLLAAADGFGYRVPELHSGDPASATSVPTPYPAACRPQAWSAAAAIVCREILRE
ncbi:glycogen debranching N-terminal domain-containing protein [Microbacterium sp. QXD-8]|uniref:Glycogen debranching N-terminal domain-containing protein n=1 Tax=Microbacterium psychrotolerans TaxID=3068321 RepID=A0ABU0Z613_9MICO|nr:glycogen debranching N-terminal domain-containing protein [Microbacterium sp. QXD-8]MDQ7880033.1 glycogen debranching N-terminal domain-containing protein [Microbacterium sp. QXD-8]